MPFLLKVYMNLYHADNALALAHVVFFPIRGPDVFSLSFFFWLWHGLFCILITVLHLVWNKSLNVQKWSWDRANKDSRLFLLFCLCECWKSVTPCLGSGFCYSESHSSCRTLARDAHFFLDASCSVWIDFFLLSRKGYGVRRLAQTWMFTGDRYLMSCFFFWLVEQRSPLLNKLLCVKTELDNP